jgi:hypothetical protein
MAALVDHLLWTLLLAASESQRVFTRGPTTISQSNVEHLAMRNALVSTNKIGSRLIGKAEVVADAMGTPMMLPQKPGASFGHQSHDERLRAEMPEDLRNAHDQLRTKPQARVNQTVAGR